MIAKASYGRTAGTPLVCAANQESQSGLCYPRCSAGYYGVGQVLNSVPEAHDEIVRTPKDTPANLAFPFDDLSDETTQLIIVKDPEHGTEGNNAYTPAPGFEGADTILWKVTDGKNESNVAITTILVGAVGTNSAPVAIDRMVQVDEDTPITITVSCTDAENDPLMYQLLQKPQHGEYRWLPPNQVVYTPTLNFAGTDQFTFRSYDGRDVSNVSTVTLQVAPVNDAPLALPQTITTTRNSNAGILLQAHDPEGDAITYTVVTSPTHGELSGAAPDLLYVPAKEFVGTDGLVFRASDGQGAAQEAAVAINVLPQNSAPAAPSQVLTTTEETALTIDLQADDPDGDDLVFTLVMSPTLGSLAGDGAAWVYTPAAGFSGEEGFAFRASDGQLETDGGVTIQVVPGPAEASVAGFVYDDANRNGQPDAEETGAGGVRVTLVPALAAIAKAADGLADSLEVTTDAAGTWRIERVPLGQYTLQITSASGVTLAGPYTALLQVGKRGFVAGPIAGVTVTQRSVYLPGLAK